MSDLINPVSGIEFLQKTVARGGASTQSVPDSLVLAQTNLGAVTVVLPLSASQPQGTCVTVQDFGLNASVNNITINGNGTNIDGAATLVLNNSGEVASLVLDGAQWTRVSAERSFNSSDKVFERWSESADPSVPQAMGGDVIGTTATATVIATRGVVISAVAPVAGQALIATSAVTSAWSNIPYPASYPMGGDVTGTTAASTVVALRGLPLSATPPVAVGDLLTFTGAAAQFLPLGGTFTAGSVIFRGATALSQDNANFFFNDTNDQLGIGTNTFTSVRQKLYVRKSSAAQIYGQIDGAFAPGVTDCSGTPNLLSASPYLGLVMGSQIDANQFGIGNGSLYACARSGVAGSPPTLAPFTGMSCYDNAAFLPPGPGFGRALYFGGGGWVSPDANDITFYTAALYDELVDQGVLRLHINANGAVSVGSAGATAVGLFQVDGLLGTVGARFGSLVRHENAIQDTAVISPTALAGASNNYNPAGLSTTRTIRQDVSAASSLTGLVAQVSGQRVTIINIATNVLFTLTLNHESAASTAANRFSLSGLANLLIPAGGSVDLWYDGTSSRWRPVG